MSDSIIKSLGAGSGIDTTSLVSQLVEIERAPGETFAQHVESLIQGLGSKQDS